MCWYSIKYLVLDRIWSRTRGKALKQRRDEDRVDEWPQSLGSWAGAGLGSGQRDEARSVSLESKDETAKRIDEGERRREEGSEQMDGP